MEALQNDVATTPSVFFLPSVPRSCRLTLLGPKQPGGRSTRGDEYEVLYMICPYG
jgi:hypothetical protein